VFAFVQNIKASSNIPILTMN